MPKHPIALWPRNTQVSADHNARPGPVASSLLALAEHTGASGRELIDALVLRIEPSCRVGNARYPEHYDCGGQRA